MSNATKLKKRALDFEQKKQFDKALDTYMQVLDVLGDHVDEADVALYNRVGDLLLRQGNVGAAVDHYERAVDLYTDGGFHNNAIALCNKILRNAPGRNSVYYKLGRISAKKGFTNDAKQNFLEYADRMQRIGQFEEAFRALKEFADLCPDQDDIRLMLADQLVRGDRKAEAIEQLQFLFEKFEAEGRAQEARATVERMRAIDPSHLPTSGVSRPTPKVNDLIFLDVNYDGPAQSRNGTSRNGTGSHSTVPADRALPAQALHASAQPVVDRAPAVDPAPEASPAPVDTIDGFLSDIGAEATMPAPGGDSPDSIEVLPVDGLSPGATFGESVNGSDAAQGAYGIVSHTDTGFITGFEETSLGGMEGGVDAVAPISDIEHSTPMMLDDAGVLDLPGDADMASIVADDAASSQDDEGIAGGDDPFPMIDMPLELVDDAPATAGELTFIFPDQEAAPAWSPDPVAEGTVEPEAPVGADSDAADGEPTDPPLWPAQPGDELRLEPLLQLPEIGMEPEAGDDSSPEIPLIAQGEDDSEYSDDDTPSTGPELHFLAMGNDDDEPAPSTRSEIAGFERLDIGGAQAASFDVGATPLHGVAALRASIDRAPNDWELRRRLAEALLEEGDRNGGLAAFEVAMLGFERAGDIRSASAVVNEMIRVEPGEVRFHQKRVEYAVRSNDRSLLAEAYFSLAESLFQMGELEKSRAVYARVLELSPGDARARSALESMGVIAAVEPPAARESAAPPSTNGKAPVPAAPVAPVAAAPVASAPVTPPAPAAPESVAPAAAPVARPREEEPGPEGAGDFVNLSDWLREDEPVKNTRMVVDVKEPEIEEQVDFTEMLSMFKKGVAANMDDSDHEAHYDLGVAYKEMGLLDEAISEFQKALRGTELRARTYEALGQCFIEKGQHQIAVTILSRALGDRSYTDDMLVGVLYLLGYASETLGRWADAQRFYERVFAVDIEFRDIGERLATAERGGK